MTLAAKMMDVEKSANDAAKGLQWPTTVKLNRLMTMNHWGGMITDITDLAHEFIQIASTPGKKVLEIGPAFGNVCLQALQSGAENYTVVEREEKHLKILALKTKQDFPDKTKSLTMIHGTFPRPADDLLNGSKFDAIFSQEVVGSFSQCDLKYAFYDCFNNLLNPGGKLMLSGLTPWNGFVKETYKDIFENDWTTFLDKVRHGTLQVDDRLPGFVESFHDFGKEKLASKGMDIRDMNMGSDFSYFLFHPLTMTYLLKKGGLNVEKIFYCPRTDYFKSEGKESLIVIAQKPA